MVGGVLLSHCRWLDSARSLYEQDVETNSHMYLRFKYYSIMDLDMRVSVLGLRACVCVHVCVHMHVHVYVCAVENILVCTKCS